MEKVRVWCKKYKLFEAFFSTFLPKFQIYRETSLKISYNIYVLYGIYNEVSLYSEYTFKNLEVKPQTINITFKTHKELFFWLKTNCLINFKFGRLILNKNFTNSDAIFFFIEHNWLGMNKVWKAPSPLHHVSNRNCLHEVVFSGKIDEPQAKTVSCCHLKHKRSNSRNIKFEASKGSLIFTQVQTFIVFWMNRH